MEVNVIGAPTDFGANRRGVDMGTSAIRYANLFSALREMGIKVKDLGDINIRMIRDNNSGGEFLTPLADICGQLAVKVKEVVEDNNFPLILGGDHSITIGNLAGLSKVRETGLIWFDAHGDFNTYQTSPTGNLHGMALAAIVGKGSEKLVNCGGISPKVKEENTVIVGVRDLDKKEKRLLKNSNVTVFSMDDIDRLGMYEVINQALKIAGENTAGLHVSFDLDVVDPLEAPGVGTPVRGGISYREAHLALEVIAEANVLTSLDVVEVNPILDHRNQTARLAVDLIKSALGKKIL